MQTKTENSYPQGGQTSLLSLRKFLSAWLIVTFVLLLRIGDIANAQCVSHADCDDGNLCTTDKCRQGICQHKPFPKLEFEYDEHLCIGDSAHIKNESEGVDPAATYYLDWQSDGSIDFSLNASLLPEDSTLAVPFSGSFSFTVIVVNPNGCSDTLDASVSILDCDDGDLCTKDECEDDGCEHGPICHDDDDGCAVNECVSGVCISTPINCDDGDPCTKDKCDDGECEHEFSGPELDFEIEGDLCLGGIIHIKNESEHVDPNATYYLDLGRDGSIEGSMSASDLPDDSSLLIPLSGDIDFTVIVVNPNGCSDTLSTRISILDCDDGDLCTRDECEDEGCRYISTCCASDEDCHDSGPCTRDFCDNGICNNVPISCDDGDPCTTDACDDDGCKHRSLCHDDDDDCAMETCDNGICVTTANNCDDDNLCTRDECDDGECEHKPVKCNDDNACTIDACDAGTGDCIHTAIVCDDSDLCTKDRCTGTGCRFTAIKCDDDNDCTLDECVSGVCTYTSISCDDGDLCTRDECDDGECEFRLLKCHDENSCTIDACDNGVCSHTPVVCDDNNPCTIDRCTGDGCKFRRTRGCSAKESGSDNEFATDAPAYDETDVALYAYPNPFADKLNIEFSLAEDSKVILEIYNLAGQKLATIFDGTVKASELKKAEYSSSESVSGGMIIYRLQTAQGSFYNKAMMLK